MKLEIRRGRDYTNGGNYYMLLNGEKISPNGGWCRPESLALLGKGFGFDSGEGVEVSVRYGDGYVTWIPDKLITPRIPIEYPLYAQCKYNQVIFLFEAEKIGTVIWIPKKRDKTGNVGVLLNEKNIDLHTVTDRSFWKILEHFDVFSFNARHPGNSVHMNIDLAKGKDKTVLAVYGSVSDIIRNSANGGYPRQYDNTEIW